jgi:hypothetical protein
MGQSQSLVQESTRDSPGGQLSRGKGCREDGLGGDKLGPGCQVPRWEGPCGCIARDLACVPVAEWNMNLHREVASSDTGVSLWRLAPLSKSWIQQLLDKCLEVLACCGLGTPAIFSACFMFVC